MTVVGMLGVGERSLPKWPAPPTQGPQLYCGYKTDTWNKVEGPALFLPVLLLLILSNQLKLYLFSYPNSILPLDSYVYPSLHSHSSL